MGTVVGLSGVLGTRFIAAPRHAARGSLPGLTFRDRADLEAWAMRGRRAVLVASETGMFAMLHQDGQAWASWGVVRQSCRVLVWDCVTLVDIGRYLTMADALAAIDGDSEMTPTENVISLMASY